MTIVQENFSISTASLIYISFTNTTFSLFPTDDLLDEEEIDEEVDGKVYPAEYFQTERGNYLCINGYFFLRNTVSQNTMSWRCTLYRSYKCKARARSDFSKPDEALLGVAHHTHARSDQRSIRRQKLTKKRLTKPIAMNM